MMFLKPLRFVLPALLAVALPAAAQVFQSSNLPIVVINTKGAVIVDEPKVNVEMGVIDNGPNQRNRPTDPWNGYRGTVGIEIRGASSQLFPKKQFGIETRDARGEDVAVSLLGFPEEADWVLNATYNDKTLIRDPLAYWLARQQGRYATRTKYVEMVRDEVYQGVYILQERIKRDKNRVNISKLEPKDASGDALTGGYILKIDKEAGGESRQWYSPFKPDPRSNFTPRFMVDYPKIGDLTNVQFDYIKTKVIEFETAIYGPDYRDNDKGFRKFIDEDSFVDYFLLTELTRNVDGYRLSAFFYKDRDSKDGKFRMGPAWDYNIAFGNGDYYDAWKPEGWQYPVNNGMLPLKPGQQEDSFKAPAWWERLLSDPVFAVRAISRWNVLRADAWSDARINRFVDSCATLLGEAQLRNFQRWNILGTYVWPNYYVGKTYAEEVTWMKNWLRLRLAWLDAQMKANFLVTGTEPLAPAVGLSVFPNPVETRTRVRYELPRRGSARLSVYDLTGRRVQTLADGERDAGSYELDWGASALTAGLYVLELQTETGVVRSRVVKR
jgi:hypothetical protein